ncbi:MAG: DUF29 domain-containing protein [Pirellulaceae bacterium]|nr:DUF29 domain-containing protein [Pirellulaceae bacterium]
MVQLTTAAMAALYETDETAWLEVTAAMVRGGQFDQVDTETLAEYLSDMARRDRREVESRLIVLLAHLLKWVHQPERRSGSWRATVVEQRQELEGLLGRGVLRNHAESVLTSAYRKAVERAAAETELASETFPAECPYQLNDLLSSDLLA